MNKIKNVTSLSYKEVKQNKKNRNDNILWWMLQSKGFIYVQVVNKICITWGNADQNMTTNYPDFRFLCTSCGSLEVYISRTADTSLPQIHCLDCGKDGISERFQISNW